MYKPQRIDNAFSALDEDKRKVFLIPLGGDLTNQKFAKVFEDDLETVLDDDFSTDWYLCNEDGHEVPYARFASINEKYIKPVAELIMQPCKSQFIGYFDGNRLNLRRDNLYLKENNS
ncbi:MAG: hypothetical protein COB54_07635 [Alphaproteobacteria bacterium]|nr:MAG: hypothetical protein COB54_07635 [Alphaproteobacteria bacterium]